MNKIMKKWVQNHSNKSNIREKKIRMEKHIHDIGQKWKTWWSATMQEGSKTYDDAYIHQNTCLNKPRQTV